MDRHFPLVLIAGIPYERRLVESGLKARGFATRPVEAAEDAAKELAANGSGCVLVIDSGTLEAPHDLQWRGLRAQHPELGTVVRCLMPPRCSPHNHGRLRFVHPDDEEGLRQAVRGLATG
jgi:hypothetical protein